MRIAIVCPAASLNNTYNGFLTELVSLLATKADIDLVVNDNLRSAPTDKFRYVSVKKFSKRYKSYNRVIYQITNNPNDNERVYRLALSFPGVLFLDEAVEESKIDSKVVESAESIIVLSHQTRRLIWKIDPKNDVHLIPNLSMTRNLSNLELDKIINQLFFVDQKRAINSNQLRKITIQGIAHELSQFGIVNDVTERIVKDLSSELSIFF